jgi:hypothetical protein
MKVRYTSHSHGGSIAVWIQREDFGPVEYIAIPRADRTVKPSHYLADHHAAGRMFTLERRSGAADRRADTWGGSDVCGRRGDGYGRRSTD